MFIFSPESGTYSRNINLNIAYSGSDAVLYITTDGSIPDTSSTIYVPGSTQISIYKDAIINICAYQGGEKIASGSASYEIELAEYTLEHTILGSYTNTTGSNPVFLIDETTIPEDVTIDSFSAKANYSNVKILLSNLVVFNSGDFFYIDEAIVEEYVDGAWVLKQDVEIELEDMLDFYSNNNDMVYSLVLDCGSSLGDDFNKIVDYTIELAKNLVAVNNYVSIIDFSKDIHIQPVISRSSLNNNYHLVDYIHESLVLQNSETALYDAVNKGLNTLTEYVYPCSFNTAIVYSLSPTLAWPEMSESYGYHVKVFDNDSFYYLNDDTLDSSTLEADIPYELEYNRVYSWRVRKKNSDSSWSEWNDIYSFIPKEPKTKVMIIFTDGKDDSSEITDTELIQRIQETSTKCYSIGLKGNGELDEEFLEDIAINGFYSSAESVDDLEAIYQRIVSTTNFYYDLSFYRDREIVATEIPIRIKLISKLDPGSDYEESDGAVIVSNENNSSNLSNYIFKEDFEAGTMPSSWSGSWSIVHDPHESYLDKSYSLKSYPVSGNQCSSIKFSVFIPKSSTIKYNYSVENGRLDFYVDNDNRNNVATTSVSPGIHTFRWTYTSDGSALPYDSYAIIDNIVIY